MIHDRKENAFIDSEEIEGLLACDYKYKVDKAEATLRWLGPPFPPEMWYQITSFFKYTQDKYRSESQVRLYLNLKEQTWAAWAYPQKANLGMAAVELGDTDEFKEQRKQFNDDWMYYGTVHHHCTGCAFQSATDQQNEKDQDGVHITVGNLTSAIYDLHIRFYRKGLMFTPKFSWFWDVEDIANECPVKFRQYLPKDFKEDTAKKEMATPVETEFPQQWKDNIIEEKRDTSLPLIAIPTSSGGTQYQHGRHNSDPLWARCKSAWGQIKAMAARSPKADYEEVVEVIEAMAVAPGANIHRILMNHKCDADDLLKEIGMAWQYELAVEMGEDQEMTEAELRDIGKGAGRDITDAELKELNDKTKSDLDLEKAIQELESEAAQMQGNGGVNPGWPEGSHMGL